MKSIIFLIFATICSAPPFKRDEGFIDYAGNFESVDDILPPDNVQQNEIQPMTPSIPDDNSDDSGLVDLAGISDHDSDQRDSLIATLVESFVLDVSPFTTSESFSTPDEIDTVEEDDGLIDFAGIP